MLLNIIDYYSIIVEVNLELRGFTEFTKRTLPLHVFNSLVGDQLLFLLLNTVLVEEGGEGGRGGCSRGSGITPRVLE